MVIDPFVAACGRMEAESEIGLPLATFDRIIVAFSGGKDSLACTLLLLELGLADKVELWHHQIDPPGRPFMDWPCTPAYCKAVARALGLPIYMSMREGGFERELRRHEAPTAPVVFQTPTGKQRVGGTGPAKTRGLFPMPGAIESGRWCSAILKIDVGRRVFANDPRFAQGSFLLVSGERAEESAARRRYLASEEDPASSRRRVVRRWRPVHGWSEVKVWEIIRRWGVVPHPGYRLGWGRLSCMTCIFSGLDQWASARELAPRAFARIAETEAASGQTIHRALSVVELAATGTPFDALRRAPAALRRLALSEDYDERVIVPTASWTLPAGAFKKAGGPT